MNTLILKGAPVAAAINERTKAAAEKLHTIGIDPCLAIVRVGDRAEDLAYERNIIKRCDSVGILVSQNKLSESATQDELMACINRLNNDNSVHGILVFMPLPEHLDAELVRSAIAPEKDVDSVTDTSMASVYSGKGQGFPPCTAQAAMEILKFYNIPISGKRAAVLGRSLVIGKPVSMLLLSENATVTMCHSKTEDMAQVASSCDIIISAVGKAMCIDGSYFREGQTFIDVGINFTEDGKMCGDADFAAAEGLVSAITPVPGGVGAVTTAVLADHVVFAAAQNNR